MKDDGIAHTGRCRLVIAYDGHHFEGWQSQPGGNTVQDYLQRAVAETVGTTVAVHGSGRTDAGVHALGQVAHFDPPPNSLGPAQWVAALNNRLPGEIRVLRMARVAQTFHARFSAIEKTYRYRIWHDRVLPPHELHRAWHVPQALDVPTLIAAAELIEGEHDFGAFGANRGPIKRSRASRVQDPAHEEEPATVRTMHSARVNRRGPLITIDYTATGFLYRMARLLTGALVRVALGRMSDNDLRGYLDRPAAGKCTHCAPADGLYLMRVRYEAGVRAVNSLSRRATTRSTRSGGSLTNSGHGR